MMGGILFLVIETKLLSKLSSDNIAQLFLELLCTSSPLKYVFMY